MLTIANEEREEILQVSLATLGNRIACVQRNLQLPCKCCRNYKTACCIVVSHGYNGCTIRLSTGVWVLYEWHKLKCIIIFIPCLRWQNLHSTTQLNISYWLRLEFRRKITVSSPTLCLCKWFDKAMHSKFKRMIEVNKKRSPRKRCIQKTKLLESLQSVQR